MNTTNLNVARAVKADDNRLVSPLDLLDLAREELHELEASGKPANKAIVILLRDVPPDKAGNGSFITDWMVAGLRVSETIALLDVVKADFHALISGGLD